MFREDEHTCSGIVGVMGPEQILLVMFKFEDEVFRSQRTARHTTQIQST